MVKQLLQTNLIHMDYKKYQSIIILVIMKLKRIVMMAGTGLAYLPNEGFRSCIYGPLLGKKQLLLDPCINELEDFFNKMFLPSIFDTIAESTNRYVTESLQQRGEYYTNFYLS